MLDTYNGGHTKALMDLRDTISKHDFKYLAGWTKEKPKAAKPRSSFSRFGVAKMLNFFKDNYTALMKWGPFIEFGIKPNSGEFFILTKDCDNDITAEYDKGYRDAIQEVIDYFEEHSTERIFGKKSVVSIIDNMLSEQMTFF